MSHLNMFLVFAIALCIESTISQTVWKAQALFNDVPWNTNMHEEKVEIVGDIKSVANLNGIYLQNGGAIWQYKPDEEPVNYLAGLAMIRMFRFEAGNITFSARLVNDSFYKLMYNMNKNQSIPVNTTNIDASPSISIRKIATSHILASGSQGTSTWINTTNLNVIQEPYIYNDSVGIIETAAPPHAQIDPNTNELFHMFVHTNDKKKAEYYQLYHIKPNSNTRILAENKIYIEKINNNIGEYEEHMNGLTPHYYIICESQIIMVREQRKVSWKIADRYTGDIIANYTSDKFAYYHYVNSYEFMDEITNKLYIISDIVIFDNFTSFLNATNLLNMQNNPSDFASIAKTWNVSRFIFPLNESRLHIIPKPLTNITGISMPTIYYEKYNTMPYQYFYSIYATSTSSYMDALVKIQVPLITNHQQYIDFTQNWNANNLTKQNYKIWTENYHYNAEAYFVPMNSNDNNIHNEDDGFILSVTLDGNVNSSYLLILNATTMKKIATAYPDLDDVGGVLPSPLHARYYQQYYGF
eukprot:11852_1